MATKQIQKPYNTSREEIKTASKTKIVIPEIKKESIKLSNEVKKQEKRLSKTTFIAKMLFNKATDNEIFKQMLIKFGDNGKSTSKKSHISCIRSKINAGVLAKKQVSEMKIKLPILAIEEKK
jgi:hypothetical protein